jgi:hypothetical protein
MMALPVFEANVGELRKPGPETAAISVFFPTTTGNDLARRIDLDHLDYAIKSTHASFVLYPATSLFAFWPLSGRVANIWAYSD